MPEGMQRVVLAVENENQVPSRIERPPAPRKSPECTGLVALLLEHGKLFQGFEMMSNCASVLTLGSVGEIPAD